MAVDSESTEETFPLLCAENLSYFCVEANSFGNSNFPNFLTILDKTYNLYEKDAVTRFARSSAPPLFL